jgi:hypothetical protein
VKALAVLLVVLLVLAHPAATVAVLSAELTVCGALGVMIWRVFRAHPYPYWRTA